MTLDARTAKSLACREAGAYECVGELVVERLAPGWRANTFPKSVPRSRMAASKRIIVARLCAVAMCLDAAENPMMYVPWWVNIGWFHAMRSSSSGNLHETQSSTSTIRARLSALKVYANYASGVLRS